MKPDHCDFCHSGEFDDVYSPIGSLRQVKVAVCRHCGLSYSRYADVPYSRDPRASGDADWGNIRWAKGFRLEERGFSLDEAKHAAEAFITGATTLVMPVWLVPIVQ